MMAQYLVPVGPSDSVGKAVGPGMRFSPVDAARLAGQQARGAAGRGADWVRANPGRAAAYGGGGAAAAAGLAGAGVAARRVLAGRRAARRAALAAAERKARRGRMVRNAALVGVPAVAAAGAVGGARARSRD